MATQRADSRSSTLQELLRAGIRRDDQKARVTDDNPKVALAFRGRVRLGIMPVSLFMTGRTYSLQRLDKVRKCMFCCVVRLF